jgi:hypothetical protein
MLIENTDRGLYIENTRVFGVFRYISSLKRPRAPFKLTYKVRFFNLLYSERSGLLK